MKFSPNHDIFKWVTFYMYTLEERHVTLSAKWGYRICSSAPQWPTPTPTLRNGTSSHLTSLDASDGWGVWLGTPILGPAVSLDVLGVYF